MSTHYEKYGREYYHKNKDRILKKKQYDYTTRWKREIQKLYGITEEQYQTLWFQQDGKCAICKQPSDKRLHIDHCHLSKKVRGLLCGPCNRGLGLFKDNPDLLIAAKDYLECGK